MRDRIIEVMARRFRALGLSTADALRGANEALHALESAGIAVVPREPTEAMLDSGGSAIIRPSIYMGGTPPGAKRRARDVWSAMLAATKPTQEEPDPPYTIKRRAS